jgi:hypothetical protein
MGRVCTIVYHLPLEVYLKPILGKKKIILQVVKNQGFVEHLLGI